MEKSEKKRKYNSNVAGVLALLGGIAGLHWFYMGEWKKGLLYLLFCWTGVPALISLIDGTSLLIGENT